MVRRPRKREPARNSSRRVPLRICVVTPELYGWNPTTEANRAIYGLAALAAGIGDAVTLLWAPLPSDRNNLSDDYEKWLADESYQNHLIKLHVIKKSDQLLPDLQLAEHLSWAVHHHLETVDYDVVYFALEGGLGYYSLLSKECGTAHQATDLLVLATEPREWQLEADRTFVRSTREIATCHMERYCAQACDRLILNSSYLKSWMKEKGWSLSPKCETLFAPQPFNRFVQPGIREPRPLDELVFINGFGERFGLAMFCDVLDRIAGTGICPTITTLGYFDKLGGEHTGGILLRRGRKWPFPLQMLPLISEEGIIQYLLEKNCLLVMTYSDAIQPAIIQSCLKAGIPFVATNVGGIGELVATKSHKSCLSQPEPAAIAEKIVSALEKGQPSISPLRSFDDQRNLWIAHLDEMAERKSHRMKTVSSATGASRTRGRSRKRPLVTIILVHHDRPKYLAQALRSVKRQDYDNIELIIVDDGSKTAEAHAYLDELEKQFRRKRGWRIMREPNRYLGAARNTGIRAANGEFILFLDDDNALFEHAVSTFVTAMTSSGSDICTAFSKLLYEPEIPADESRGFIQYFPLGGCLDLALFHNSLGDANAMIRKTVFKKIGYLVEDYGFVAQDWEFFARAILEGLKVRIIPKPLYWYRSTPQSMFRTSNWYKNRLPILELFKRYRYQGTDKAIELAIFQNVSDFDKNSLIENLWFDLSNDRHRKLARLDANSQEAFNLLAEIASVENRPDTALVLLGHVQGSNFIDRVQRTLSFRPPSEHAVRSLSAPFAESTEVPYSRLREFTILSREHEAFYVGSDNRLFVETKGTMPTFGMLKAGCPTGTLSVTAHVELGEITSRAADVMVAIVNRDLMVDDRDMVDMPEDAVEASSGWVRVSRPDVKREVIAQLELPSLRPQHLLIAVRCHEQSAKSNALVQVNSIVLRKALAAGRLRRPQVDAPAYRRRAYSLGETEFDRAKLVTPYPSKLPLLLVDKKAGGLFVRPHKKGPVVAVLTDIVPPFAKHVVANVEIAHENASDFEFAIAIFRSDDEPNWNRNFEAHVMKFSGWHRQTDRFTLMQIPLELDQRVKARLSLALAIRVPRGSNPEPANSFFRSVTFQWND